MSPESPRTRLRYARQQAIVEHVVAHGSATVADLTRLTGASVMTVHRDLDQLAARGIVRRFHGGVTAQPSTVFESSSEYRMRVQVAQKEALAAAALAFVDAGMSILLDDSTSALALARRLGPVGPLTVLTNYLPGIDALRGQPDIRLIGIGGDYSPTHDSFLGIGAQEAVSAHTVDVVFVSSSGIDTAQTFHQEQEVVLVKRAMLAAGRRRVLLMDSTKIGRTALHRVAPVGDFDHVVLDADADREFVRQLREVTDVRIAAR